MLSFKPVFSLSSFTLIKRLFRSSSLSAISVLVLHSICQQIWKTQQWPQDWKRSVFIPIPKKGNAKDAQYSTIALISHASNVMLKILQARLQEYMNRELLDVQAGFRKGRGTRDQIANIHWIIKKARAFQKNIYFCFIDYAKAFDCVDHNQLWKILKDDAVKGLHSICQQIWKTQQWPQDSKRSVFFQSQRKAMPKNAQTTTQLHSSHTLVK